MLKIIENSKRILNALELTNEDGKTEIIFPRAIIKKNVKFETKSGTGYSSFYQFNIPAEIKETLKIKNGDYIYFNKYEGSIYLTSGRPCSEDSWRTKVAKQILIPRKYFKNLEAARELYLIYNVNSNLINVIIK